MSEGSSEKSRFVKGLDFKTHEPLFMKTTGPKFPPEYLSLPIGETEEKEYWKKFLSSSVTLSNNALKVNPPILRSNQYTPNGNNKRKKHSLPPIDNSPKADFIFGDNFARDSKLSIPEIHAILSETNQRKKDKLTLSPMRKTIKENDYDELFISDEKQELSGVKSLEKWNLEMKKKKILTSDNNDFIQAQKQKHQDVQPADMPKVNALVINKIMGEDDDERKFRFKTNYMSVEQIEEEEENNSNENKYAFRGSLDNFIQENTRNILDELILRKIKKYMETIDIDKAKDDQLKFQIQRITDEVLGHFQSLKMAGSMIVLQNHIAKMVKKIKTKKYEYKKLFDFSKENTENTNSSFIDYKTSELILIKNFEKNLDDIRKLRENINSVNKRIHDLKKDMKVYFAQLEHVRKKYTSLDETAELVVPKQVYADKLKRKIAGQNNAVEEYLRIQRVKTDLKKQEAQLQEKMNDLESQILRATSEYDRLEHDMRAAKNLKAHTKLQLKELYYKILKDDGELTDLIRKPESNVSYVWIVRALWKINSDVNEHAFPDFLDKENVSFLFEYAKSQVELDNICKKHNLTGYTVALDEFRYLDALNSHKDMNQEENNEKFDQTQDHLMNYARMTQKNLKTLLIETNDKIVDMKKQNLKAKRQVQVTQYTSKGRQIVSKWEDVNPNDSHIPLVDFNGQPYEALKSIEETVNEEDTLRKNITKDSSQLKLSGTSPVERAIELQNKIDTMKKNEIARIIKLNIAKDYHSQTKNQTLKIFICLFGKKEGEEYFSQYLREKRVHDQRAFQKQRPIAAKSDKTPLALDKIPKPVPLNKDSSRVITDQSMTKDKFFSSPLGQSQSIPKFSPLNTQTKDDLASSRNIKVEN